MTDKKIKWSQWDTTGLIRCGFNDYKTLIKWTQELGHEAKECLMKQDKPHAIYARKMHDDSGRLTEIRMYCNAYLTDEELDTVAVLNPNDTLYVVHK